MRQRDYLIGIAVCVAFEVIVIVLYKILNSN